MSDRPQVRCLAAWMYGEGQILKRTHYVTLEEAEQMKAQGYTIVGPDQHDLFELATWERQRAAKPPRAVTSWLRRNT